MFREFESERQPRHDVQLLSEQGRTTILIIPAVSEVDQELAEKMLRIDPDPDLTSPLDTHFGRLKAGYGVLCSSVTIPHNPYTPRTRADLLVKGAAREVIATLACVGVECVLRPTRPII